MNKKGPRRKGKSKEPVVDTEAIEAFKPVLAAAKAYMAKCPTGAALRIKPDQLPAYAGER